MDNINFKQQVVVQMRFNDVDAIGHVNNTVVQQYFDIGRVAYFQEVLKTPPDWGRFRAVIASIKTEFLQPIHFEDSISVKTKVTHIGNKSFNLVQHIVNQNDDVKATCVSVMVGFDKETQHSAEISDAWRESISGFEGDIS